LEDPQEYLQLTQPWKYQHVTTPARFSQWMSYCGPEQRIQRAEDILDCCDYLWAILLPQCPVREMQEPGISSPNRRGRNTYHSAMYRALMLCAIGEVCCSGVFPYFPIFQAPGYSELSTRACVRRADQIRWRAVDQLRIFWNRDWAE
jgi:hypothetical protein